MESLPKDSSVSNVFYNSDENCFTIEKDSDNSYTIAPVLTLDSEYIPDEYCLYPLESLYEISENQIYEVYDTEVDIRLGWLFPFQSLLSREHSYHDNPYYLKYAYVAIYKLLESGVINPTDDDEYQIRNITDQKVLLVLSNENCERIGNFDIDDYIIDLYHNGYICKPSNQQIKEYRNQTGPRLNIKPISKALHKNLYIIEMYKTILPQCNLLPFAKFHMLYQIIELLIIKVFEYKFNAFVTISRSGPRELVELRDEFSSILNEKNRVNALITEYVGSIHTEYKALCNKSCIDLLSFAHKNSKEIDLAGNLYKVRCLIFHSFSIIPTDKWSLIDDVNEYFEKVLRDILITFTGE